MFKKVETIANQIDNYSSFKNMSYLVCLFSKGTVSVALLKVKNSIVEFIGVSSSTVTYAENFKNYILPL